nr:glycoside hydrolase family 43 protein [uncultured Carboxylicivirga sp.]
MKYHFGLLLFLTISILASCQHKQNDNRKQISFKPGTHFLDNDSVHINAHGGGILFSKGKYYWFGEFKTAGEGGNTAKVGVSCYSSKDLYNWENEGIALKVVNEQGSDIEKGCVIERPKVIYNDFTHEFIMWFHLELKGKGYSAARTGLAVSDKVTGPYTFVRSLRPNANIWPESYPDTLKNYAYSDTLKWWTPAWYKAIDKGLFVQRDLESGQMSRDMTLFVDDDGTAYHIHSSEDNLTIHISELSKDYTDFTGKYIRIFPAGHNEAPALFKKDDNYYLMTSGCTGWDPNAARMFKASSIWGPWEAIGNPCVGKDADLTFHSQSTFILPVNGQKNAFIYMGDRWNPKNPTDGRYVWLPIEFNDDKPVIRWRNEWDLSVFN